MIEDTYVAFRKAINQMVLNTTCGCDACANINSLDLKFFVHHGMFSIEKLDAHEELVGHDVNTIFRMSKNDVVERTGISAYTLFFDAAVSQVDLDLSDGEITVPDRSEEAPTRSPQPSPTASAAVAGPYGRRRPDAPKGHPSYR